MSETNKDTDIDVFLPELQNLTLSNGDLISVKPLNWGKEIKVCQLVSKFFGDNNLVEIFTLISDEKNDDGFASISKLIIPLISEAPQVITQIVAIMLDKDTTYVEDSLTSDDVMQLLVPFLGHLFTKFTTLFQSQTKNLKSVK